MRQKNIQLTSFRFKKTINGRLGKYLGSGAEGKVYQWGSKKIIKIFEPFNAWYSHERTFKYLINYPSPYISRIYDYGTATVKTIKNNYHTIFGCYPYIVEEVLYYYIAEKLYPISKKEENFMDQYIMLNYNSQPSFSPYVKNIKTTKYNPNFIKSLKRLCSDNLPIRIADLHSDNLMRTKDGKYKVADLGMLKVKLKHLRK